MGAFGVDYIIRAKKSAYFPRRHTIQAIDDGILIIEEDAPVFSYPVYCVFPEDFDPTIQAQLFRSFDAATEDYVTRGLVNA